MTFSVLNRYVCPSHFKKKDKKFQPNVSASYCWLLMNVHHPPKKARTLSWFDDDTSFVNDMDALRQLVRNAMDAAPHHDESEDDESGEDGGEEGEEEGGGGGGGGDDDDDDDDDDDYKPPEKDNDTTEKLKLDAPTEKFVQLFMKGHESNLKWTKPKLEQLAAKLKLEANVVLETMIQHKYATWDGHVFRPRS